MESVLNANDHRLEDAVHNLHALYLGDVSGTNNALSADAVVEMSKSAVQGLFIVVFFLLTECGPASQLMYT